MHPNRGHCAPKFAPANKNFTHNPPPLATPPSLSHFLSKFDADFLHLQNQVDRGVAREKKNKTILWPEFCRRLLSGSKSLAGRVTVDLVGRWYITDRWATSWVRDILRYIEPQKWLTGTRLWINIYRSLFWYSFFIFLLLNTTCGLCPCLYIIVYHMIKSKLFYYSTILETAKA